MNVTCHALYLMLLPLNNIQWVLELTPSILDLCQISCGSHQCALSCQISAVLHSGMGDFGVIEICSVIYGAYYAVRRHTP